jgi:hypothetical protein
MPSKQKKSKKIYTKFGDLDPRIWIRHTVTSYVSKSTHIRDVEWW